MSSRGPMRPRSTKTPAAASRNEKSQLATRAAMLISGGKFENVKSLREKDTTGEFADVDDQTIRARLRRIGDSAELQTAAKDMVAKLGRVATQQTTRRARAPPKPSRTSRMKRPPRRTRGPPSTIALRRRRASGAS